MVLIVSAVVLIPAAFIMPFIAGGPTHWSAVCILAAIGCYVVASVVGGFFGTRAAVPAPSGRKRRQVDNKREFARKGIWLDDPHWHCAVNPATGLPMMGGIGGFDAAGNLYGNGGSSLWD